MIYSRRTRSWLVGVACAHALACAGPRPEWKVYLATNAPIPALGQQLTVEFLDDSGGSATDPVRLLDGSRPELWPISFGIVPGTVQPRLRVRLFRLDQAGTDGLPLGDALIDATALLPLRSDGIVDVAFPLAAECFGIAPNPSEHMTCDPATGALAPEPELSAGADEASLPVPGSWGPARAIDCADQPPPGMICLPGGAFILGSVNYFPGTEAPVPEHLVELGAFALDAQEVTVGAIRNLVQLGLLDEPLTGDPTPGAAPPECTYLGATNAGHDAYPMNCVSWQYADEACRLFGKRLPTEAEYEYAAGNTGLRTPLPWGSDSDLCGHAVVAIGRTTEDEATECRGAATVPGPVAGGQPLDVTDRGIANLAGNVDEWVADWFDDYAAPCWTTTNLLVNPVCSQTMRSPAVHAIRGGAWALPPLGAFSYARDAALADVAAVATGFRCAVSE